MSVFDGYSTPQERKPGLGPLSTNSALAGARGCHSSPSAPGRAGRSLGRAEPAPAHPPGNRGTGAAPGEAPRVGTFQPLTIKHGPRCDKKKNCFWIVASIARLVVMLPRVAESLHGRGLSLTSAGLCCQPSLPFLSFKNLF